MDSDGEEIGSVDMFANLTDSDESDDENEEPTNENNIPQSSEGLYYIFMNFGILCLIFFMILKNPMKL